MTDTPNASTRPNVVHVHADVRRGAHDTNSDDFVHWWLPTLGPTATLLARQLAASVTDNGRSTLDCSDLARLLGLGDGRSTLWRAFERLACFGVIVFASADVVTIRTQMPALRPAQLTRHPHAADYLANIAPAPAR